MTLKGFRSAILDFVDDPFYVSESESVRYIPDGLLVLEQGKVKELGDYELLKEQYVGIPIESYPHRLLLPGFIDLHIHFPQTGIIAAYGEQLLEWLEKYIFPTEHKFKDKAYCDRVAPIFIDQLLRNGTTTAVVLGAVFPESVDSLFEECDRRNLRTIVGKVMMDRHAPDFLCDTAESSYYQSRALIEKWHGKNRLLYAVTPRFAPTSTPQQLTYARQLLSEFPDTYLHTHLSENIKEVEWVQQLFPDSQGYLDVYDRFGLVGERSIFAHCVQLTDAEFDRLAQTKAAIAFCPTSNLFLGSGLFNIEQATAKHAPIKLGLATDVGAGTSFSLLQTASEAYKVAQLQQQKFSPFQAMFLATLGGARALKLEDKIGNFDVGKEADFVVLDPRATPVMAFRNEQNNEQMTPITIEELGEQLFSTIVLGDDRTIVATYVMGELVHAQ
ncbi:MAG: guanine deaminase [Oscillatoriales cyanobacterium]|uniref:Guanine deaminase n=1 Tax=Microcoleus anatoxicus PTRS2 TaxID=2705321 RepID=A0ABU8YPC3_9CYAN|nr:MAG: guanine deaminase [Oscillatoriales cyanobacterium]TAD94122.1 MAG: guanine deaminase [Oscillatoriales cyanobacterium]TAE06332.1 MAG: guanine deaminase [Oscillatoriales cyanobacterium]TAF02116.1 MAG: guanine deaminase [Oscillatoriales cyanobacterium]TAF37113.1 MAG: guanine deaminase [Oscillatoriales cyanobacterium]